MKTFYRMLLLLLVLTVPLMVALGEGDVEKGKAVFGRCSICHGDSGQGNPAIAKALDAQIPDLASKEVQELDDAALKKVILEGKDKMQPVHLSDTEVDDVISFMRSLKKPSSK